MSNKITNINITELHLFRDNPFKVRKDEAFDELVESITAVGVYEPLIISPDKDDGGYIIISGQRRFEAAKTAGLETVPAVINELDRDEIIIAVVDNNICLRDTLPSEKAYGYKMKIEAIKHQGKRYGQNVHKLSRDEISENESGRTVQRYIRLTYLIPELLKLVDESRIGISPAVEISYFPIELQKSVYSYYEEADITPTVSQAQRIRKQLNDGNLTEDTFNDIMNESKPNQKEAVRIPTEKVQKYFSSYKDPKFIENFIEKAIEFYVRHLERERRRQRSGDAR